ncbi:MAG: phosphatase PAP2 family protein [Nanoarchaeota archaeon]
MKKRDRNFLIAIIVLAAIFIFIAFCIKFDFLFSGIDKKLSSFFFLHQSDIGIKIMKSFSFLASLYFLPIFSAIIAAFFYFNRMGKMALFYLFNVVFGAVIGEGIKSFFGRARPLNPFENNPSFPSTHSLMAVVVYCSFAWIFWNKNRRISYIFLVLPLIIGFSRIYLNVHWLSDVLGGFVFGILLVISFVWLFDVD